MNKDELKKYTVSIKTTIYEALSFVDQNSRQMAILVDQDQCIIGVITDGDIRRAILKGIPLDSPIISVVNRNPLIGGKNEPKKALISRMQDRSVSFIPLVNDENKFEDIVFLSDLLNISRKNNSIIIMAGGKGTRLGELTKNCPKPMLKIGSKPILETIITHLSLFGFHDFHISVNYLKEQIMDYFEDGEKMGVKISYLHEKKPLGTAGALANFEPQNSEPVVVMNGDIYTDLDFTALIDIHKSNNAAATVCLRKYDYQIPYGVVRTNNRQITTIEEKPVLSYFVNAGIYTFDPMILKMIPKNTYYPMTKFLEKLLKNDKSVYSHEIEGIWIDIGRHDDFNNASQIATMGI